MELAQIIKSSLSLFMIFSVILIILSYIIFKVKDRSRIKPYMRVNIQTNSPAETKSLHSSKKKDGIITHEDIKEAKNHRLEQIKLEQMRQEQIRLNQLKDDQQEIKIKENIPKPSVIRFKVVNERTPTFQEVLSITQHSK